MTDVPAKFIAEELDCAGHTKRAPTLAPGTCHLEFFENDANGIEAALNFVCPCGCAEVDFILLSTTKPDQARRCWVWDGNREKPTVTPSIYRIGAACKWHGFLIAGVFQLTPGSSG